MNLLKWTKAIFDSVEQVCNYSVNIVLIHVNIIHDLGYFHILLRQISFQLRSKNSHENFIRYSISGYDLIMCKLEMSEF